MKKNIIQTTLNMHKDCPAFGSHASDDFLQNNVQKNLTKKTNWHRLSAMTMVMASMFSSVASLPVFAQDPTQNAAALNFVGADIESVVKAIGHYTGTTFIIDPRVKGQINLVSEKPLTKEQAFKLLASSLRLQGYAIVTADGYTKVVPEADAKLQAGPTQADGAKGDQIATQIYRLNYESANNIVTVLRPLISPNNTINANPGNNSIVITDYADNLKRLAKIIAALDVPASNDLDVVPIKHAIASDIAALVVKLTDNNAPGAGDSGRLVLLADPRTNSILIKAPSAARANLVKTLIGKLDQPTTLPGNVHVVYLKNAEAVKLAATLRSILSSDSALPSSGSSGAGLSALAPGQPSPIGQNSPNTGVVGSGLPPSSSSNSSNSAASGSGGGFIQADSATNTLIITASDPVFRNLRSVIDQLDARRAQVYVEALIVEVNLTEASDFGVQWLAATGDANSNYRVAGGVLSATNNLLGLATAATPTLGAGLSVGIVRQVGNQVGLGALARAVQTNDKGNVLSIPNVLTLDNEEARIVVGENVPFLTGSFAQATSGTSGANPFQTIERKDVGLKLTVKPQISEGGTVKLAIYQEVSGVIESSRNSNQGLSTTQRSISTNVLVDDGAIIALGGLISDDKSGLEEKVPLLGDIPILGNLFKYKRNSRTKRNLMVFLRPTIVRNGEQSDAVSLDRYDHLRTEYVKASGNIDDGGLPKAEKGRLLSLPNGEGKQSPTAPLAEKNATDRKESK